MLVDQTIGENDLAEAESKLASAKETHREAVEHRVEAETAEALSGDKRGAMRQRREELQSEAVATRDELFTAAVEGRDIAELVQRESALRQQYSALSAALIHFETFAIRDAQRATRLAVIAEVSAEKDLMSAEAALHSARVFYAMRELVALESQVEISEGPVSVGFKEAVYKLGKILSDHRASLQQFDLELQTERSQYLKDVR